MEKIFLIIWPGYPPMKFITRAFFFVTTLFVFSTQIICQGDTVYVPSDIPPSEGNLNKAVHTAVALGTLSNTVFQLEPNGYYILTDSILVPAGEHLTIVAPEPGLTQETTPPQILCTSEPTEYSSPLIFMFKCYGDITLKNLWLLYANTNGRQVGSTLSFIKDSLNADKQYGDFEGVIFDYSPISTYGSGAVSVQSNKFTGTFKNCYWKNCTDPQFRYYGRAVSFPFNTSGYHTDSLTFENCTFANIGYVYSQEGEYLKGQFADYVKFNHCTFLNVVMFSLESGWWNKLAVTNSIFVNTHMFGYIRGIYLTDEEPYGGTLWIDSVSSFGFSVPFTEQDRRILFTNSSYFIENWLSDWMYNNPASQWWRNQGDVNMIPIPQPMLNPRTIKFFKSKDFPYMNMANFYDSTNPGFSLAPSDTTAIKGFQYHRWYDSADSSWEWKPENSLKHLWPLEENLAYTNQELKTAGIGGFPLGDLYRWWLEKYIQWNAQRENENSRISYWLNTGRDSIFTGVKKELYIINKFELLQNFPNPFNPNTFISYQLATGSQVTIKVYDILGREVTTLVNEKKPAGAHKINFDASGLASGVYLYVLRADNFYQSKKMILLK